MGLASTKRRHALPAEKGNLIFEVKK